MNDYDQPAGDNDAILRCLPILSEGKGVNPRCFPDRAFCAI